MCFPRKLSLGKYSGSRFDWQKAYRAARISARNGREPNPKHSGIQWKADLIVAHERGELADPLACPVAGRLAAQRIINELLSA